MGNQSAEINDHLIGGGQGLFGAFHGLAGTLINEMRRLIMWPRLIFLIDPACDTISHPSKAAEHLLQARFFP